MSTLTAFPLDCRRRDPRCPPSMQRTMPPARHAAEALAPSMAAEGWGGGGSSSGGGGGGVVKDHAVVPPAIDDPEDDPQQRADDEGEEEGTQCSVRAMTSAPVTEPPQQCGGHKGLFGPSAPPSGPLPATEGC